MLCKYTSGKGVLFTDEQIGIKKADELYSLKKKEEYETEQTYDDIKIYKNN